MKKFIEPILILASEVLLLLFTNFDKSIIYLLFAFIFGYFFIRRAINQNEAVLNARQYKIIANNFRVNPFDTQTLNKGLSLEKEVTNHHFEHLKVKWVHLILFLLNGGAVAMVIADILPT